MSPWQRNRWIIFTSFVVELLAFRLVMPFVPLYIQQLGMTDPSLIPRWSGLILGAMPLCVAAMLPLWDRMAERTGRKFQVLRSLIGCTLGLALMAVAQSVAQLFAAYVFEGVTAGFYPQMWNLVSAGAPAGGVGEAMAVLQSLNLFVSAVGPILGGVMGDYIGLRLPYVIGAVMCAAVFVLIWLGYTDASPEDEARPVERPEGVPIRRVFQTPGVFPILGVTFLFMAFVPGIEPLVPLYLQQLVEPGAPIATLAGFAITAGSLAGAGAAVALGRMTRRRSPHALVTFSFVAGGITTIILPLIPSVEAAFALWIVRSAFTGGVLALMYGVADRHLPERVARGIYANITGAMVFGGAIGRIVTGAMGAIDLAGAFVTVGLLLVLLGFWSARAFRRPFGANAP